jgi:hypothetical protein
MTMALAGALAVTLLGCPKSSEGGGAEDAAPKTTASAADASAAKPEAGASASAEGGAGGAGAAEGASRAYAGKYAIAVGSMYVPAGKDYASVKFKNDDAKLLGDGTIALTIDPKGRVSGTTEGGALGASVVEGSSDGAKLAATVRRKDPTDDGLTGTLVAKIAGDALEGTMNLAEGNAAVVRQGTFTAAKK